MRAALFLLLASLSLCNVPAQGTVLFSTRVSEAMVDIPARLLNGPGSFIGPGPDFRAQLFLSENGLLTPIPGSLTTFRDPTGGSPALAQHVTPVVAEVPGVPPGGSATLRIRAWHSMFGSYQEAHPFWRGETVDFVVQNLGGNGQTPAYLADTSQVNGFLIVVPEPRASALIALGCLAATARFLFAGLKQHPISASHLVQPDTCAKRLGQCSRG